MVAKSQDEAGTVLPVAGDPLAFWVVGRHGTTYRVRVASESGPSDCGCKGFEHRGYCWHVAMADRFVAEGRRAAADAAVSWYLGLSEEAKREIWR